MATLGGVPIKVAMPPRCPQQQGQREIGVGLGIDLVQNREGDGEHHECGRRVGNPHAERRCGCHETSNQPTGIAPSEDQHREGKAFV